MKRTLAILLIVSVLTQCIAQFVVFAIFEMRQDYIARFLCENRNKPELKCAGKCYLRKQLGKVSTDNENPKNNLLKMEKKEVVSIFSEAAFFTVVRTLHSFKKPLRPADQALSGRLLTGSVFHPPSRC